MMSSVPSFPEDDPYYPQYQLQRLQRVCKRYGKTYTRYFLQDEIQAISLRYTGLRMTSGSANWFSYAISKHFLRRLREVSAKDKREFRLGHEKKKKVYVKIFGKCMKDYTASHPPSSKGQERMILEWDGSDDRSQTTETFSFDDKNRLYQTLEYFLAGILILASEKVKRIITEKSIRDTIMASRDLRMFFGQKPIWQEVFLGAISKSL